MFFVLFCFVFFFRELYARLWHGAKIFVWVQLSFQNTWLGLDFDIDFFRMSEKCPNMEFFLVRILRYCPYLLRKSPYSVRIQENTDQKNCNLVEQKKLRIWKLFTQCQNGSTIFCSFHISFFKVNGWSFLVWTDRNLKICVGLKVF